MMAEVCILGDLLFRQKKRPSNEMRWPSCALGGINRMAEQVRPGKYAVIDGSGGRKWRLRSNWLAVSEIEERIKINR